MSEMEFRRRYRAQKTGQTYTPNDPTFPAPQPASAASARRPTLAEQLGIRLTPTQKLAALQKKAEQEAQAARRRAASASSAEAPTPVQTSAEAEQEALAMVDAQSGLSRGSPVSLDIKSPNAVSRDQPAISLDLSSMQPAMETTPPEPPKRTRRSRKQEVPVDEAAIDQLLEDAAQAAAEAESPVEEPVAKEKTPEPEMVVEESATAPQIEEAPDPLNELL